MRLFSKYFIYHFYFLWSAILCIILTPKTICCSKLFSKFYRFNFWLCIFHVLHYQFFIIFSKLLVSLLFVKFFNFLFLSFNFFISNFYFLLSTFISFSLIIFFSNFSLISFSFINCFSNFFIFLFLNSSVNVCTLPTS